MEKSILVSILAIFAVLVLVSFVSAENLTNSLNVEVSGSSAFPISIDAGDNVVIRVEFKATTDADDVIVSAWIDDYRTDIEDKTSRFQIYDGQTYIRYLTLEVPSDIDPIEEAKQLIVRVENSEAHFEDYFDLSYQRVPRQVDVLSAEFPDTVTPGSTMSIDVVLKNMGTHKLEDIYVEARIPELGLNRRVYFGDLNPMDEDELPGYGEEGWEEYREANRYDSVERKVYLSIPDNAPVGVYDVEIEAYNLYSETILQKQVVISGTDVLGGILSGTGAQTLDVGQEVTYDLVLINSGNSIKVYTLTPNEAEGLIVSADSVVAVPAGSSETVRVRVKATDSASEGTHVVTINVESEGELVSQVSFTANVEKGSVANSVVVLTIVLAIIFVVLLIILIVLLTRKPATMETEETSYY